MENNNLNQEQRRFRRVGADLSLEYRDLRKASELPKNSLLRNISEGGVCFNTGEFMSLACRLVLSITLPNSDKPIKAISKVAWIKRLPMNDQYELGNQFLEISKQDKAQIMEFVRSSSDSSQ